MLYSLPSWIRNRTNYKCHSIFIHFLNHTSRLQCPAASSKLDVDWANSQILWSRFSNILNSGYESSHQLGFTVGFKCSTKIRGYHLKYLKTVNKISVLNFEFWTELQWKKFQVKVDWLPVRGILTIPLLIRDHSSNSWR